MDAIAGLGLGRRQLDLTDLFLIPSFPPLFPPKPSSSTSSTTSALTTRTTETTTSTASTATTTNASQTTSLTETSTTTTSSSTETTSTASETLSTPLLNTSSVPLVTTPPPVVQSSNTTPGGPRETGINTTVTAPAPVGFLQNKVLSGVVFSIVGVVALILFIVIATWAIRKRKQRKTLEEAISFDPANAGYTDSFDRDPEKLTLQRSASVRSNEGYGRDQWVSVTGPTAYAVQPPGQAYVTQQLGRNPSRYAPPSQAYRQPDTTGGYPY